MSLYIRKILFPRTQPLTLCKVSTINNHFYYVTAKKDVHFRPGIIHFFHVREVDVLFYCKLFLFEAYPDGRKVVNKMPRMSKQEKEEWDFFLDENGQITYNELCRKCDRECKQSFRAVIISCPEYHEKCRTHPHNNRFQPHFGLHFLSFERPLGTRSDT